MKKNLSLVASLCLVAGCSTFSTKQVDTSYESGEPIRTITTTVAAKTLFDSKSALTSFKASQTDKTQGANVGSLVQESSSTNSVAVLDALARIVQALPK